MTELKTINVTEEKHEIPVVDLLTGRGFITGLSGSGKSNTAGVIAEKLLEKGLPLMIIDTEGEYYGLKEEYEILHVGADEECDLQIGEEHTEKLAQITLEKNTPIILDVSGFLEEEKIKNIVKETLQHLFNKEKKLKKPYLVITEEIHEYMPESPTLDECGEMLVRIAKRGRKRGLGILGISQRPASVKKDFITQCNWRIWHRLDWENDLKVVKRVLGKNYKEKVKSLNKGEAIAELNFLDGFKDKVKFKRKETFDAGATPDLETTKTPELKSVSKELVQELQKISEKKKKKQDKMKKLETKINELQKELKEKEEELEKSRNVEDLAQRFTDAIAKGGGTEEIQERIEEIKEEKNKEIRELKNKNKKLEQKVDELEELEKNKEELEEYKEKVEKWENNKETAQEALTRLAESLDIEINPEISKYREKIKKQRKKIEELQEKIEKEGEVTENRFKNAKQFLGDELVKKYIDKAVKKSKLSEEHFWNALTYIAQYGETTTSELNPLIDLSKGNIGTVLRKLEENKVLKSDRKGKEKCYKLNMDGMSEMKELEETRNEIKGIRKQIQGETNE